MGKIRLREVEQTAENGKSSAQGVALKPLRVAGVVVRKAELIEALRIYVPALQDIQVTEDGEHFWLLLNEGDNNADSTAG